MVLSFSIVLFLALNTGLALSIYTDGVPSFLFSNITFTLHLSLNNHACFFTVLVPKSPLRIIDGFFKYR